jgi:hypothetical protein
MFESSKDAWADSDIVEVVNERTRSLAKATAYKALGANAAADFLQ